MSDVIPFQYNSEEVRVIKDEAGEPWFIGKDVCAVFEDGNPNRSLQRVSDEDRRLVDIVDALGRAQKAIAINEAGLYELLFGMQPQKANKTKGGQYAYPIHVQQRIDLLKAFRRWVTHEVLPTIRKTGSYAVTNSRFKNPDKVTFEFLAREYNGAVWIARNLGMNENQARLSANRAVSRQYGPSCMALLEVNA